MKNIIDTFQDWKAVENRKQVINGATCSCDYDLFYKDILIASYGKIKPLLDELDLIKNQQMSETIFDYFVEALAKKLDEDNQLQFIYDDKFYDLFDSVEGGYIYNVYPNEPNLIFDKDGELIDDMQLDGGLYDGKSKDIILSVLERL